MRKCRNEEKTCYNDIFSATKACKGRESAKVTYGYIRVSTKEQNEVRQLVALSDYGIEKRYLYMDKQSGKDFERPAYKRMMRRMRKGDLLVVKSIDRLGRNYTEIMEQWRIITKEKGSDIRVLDMPLLDTTQAKDLLGTLISDIVLQLLSFAAENERVNIRQRQAEGIAAAKVRGVQFGRPRKAIPEAFWEAYCAWREGGQTIRQAAKQCGMPQTTFYIKAKRQQELLTLLILQDTSELDA